MNWSDERYVKFYTRKTATWVLWPWQARCVFPLVLRECNGAGFVDCGRNDPAQVISMLAVIPAEVAAVGLEAMLADGTLTRVERGLLMPNYIEAQEATKTERAKKRDQRERERAQSTGIVSPHVTRSHPQSPAVTGCPPPAQPSPTTSPQKLAGNFVSPPPKKRKRPAAATDPRHAPLVAELVEHFEELNRGDGSLGSYGFTGRDAKAVTALLAKGPPVEVRTRWHRALTRTGYPLVRTLSELAQHWAHFATTIDPRASKFDPNQGILRSSH